MLPNNPNQPSSPQPPHGQEPQAPSYQGQAPQAPSYRGQAPQAPSYRGQASQAPSYQGQGTQTPSYQGQGTQAPSYQGQGAQAPSYQGQAHQAPSYQGQAHHAPSHQGQAHQAPSYQGQAHQAPSHRGQAPHPPSDQGQVNHPQPPQYASPLQTQNKAQQTFQQAPQPQYQQNPAQHPPQGQPENQHRYPPLQQYPENEPATQHKYPPLTTQAPPPTSPPIPEPEETPTPPSMSKHPLLMPGSILAMWAEAVDTLLQEDNGDAALLYLHIMRKGHDSPKGWTETRTLEAQLLLRHLGLYRPEACTNQAPKEERKVIKEVTPQYSTADINLRLSDKDQVFYKLNQKIEDLRCKELSMPDMKILLEIHDYLGFSPDVIFLLYTFVTGRHREQHGGYAIPPMKDVRHEANYWAKAGVKDVPTAEELILKRMQRDQWENKLEAIFKTKITDSARKHTEVWKTWNFPDTFFELAYDRTVYHAGKFNWKYAHTILENWHIHHYKTVEEIEEKDRLVGKQNSKQGGYRHGRTQNGPKMSQPSGETSAQLQEESRANMERLRKMMYPDSLPDSPESAQGTLSEPAQGMPTESAQGITPQATQESTLWEGKIEAMFQYKITDSVRKYTDLWVHWNLPDSFYEEAYKRTLYHTGKFSWAYIHKILEIWHQEQLHSLEDIFAYDKKRNTRK